MPTAADRAGLAPTISFSAVRSDDGTTLRAWTNDADRRTPRPTVLLCNALGTTPLHWPALLRPDCGVRVVSWYHRGTGGSEFPRDLRRVRSEHFVADALSVMDHFGLDRPVVAGWSSGVGTAVDLITRHPERAAGLFAVAGVPGDVFASTLAPLHVPRGAARLVTASWAHALRLGGAALSPVTTRVPFGVRSLDALARAGFVGRVPDPDLAALAFAEFLAVPVEWLSHLALNVSPRRTAGAPGLGDIAVPSLFVAGSRDLLAGARDLSRVARQVPDARYVELRSSHFIPLEHPDRLHQLLRSLLARAG